MSKPQNKNKNPDQPGQTKTMFAMEGNPNTILVIDQLGQHHRQEMWFPDVDHAFAWSRQNRCNFLYQPAAPNN